MTRKLLLDVGDDHLGFQVPERPVGTPVHGELEHGALEISLILLELALETREERQRVGRATGEADEHLALPRSSRNLTARFFMTVCEAPLVT